jgi:flagellar basal-body rod protein FlgB
MNKQGNKATNIRDKTNANNMENVNKKDYKRFNVVFEENLKNQGDFSKLELKRTNPHHFSSNNSNNDDSISIEQDKSTSMRNDGNNVDLDIEKVNQAANTLKYNALITDINNRFNNLKAVIK